MKELVLQKCPKCDTTKTGAEFNKGSRASGLSAYCKGCSYISHVCRTYKISWDAYLEMVERANGLCEMCGELPTRLVVDHDHDTNEVRGLICDPCNHFLGMIETKPNIQLRADTYLANHATKTTQSSKG